MDVFGTDVHYFEYNTKIIYVVKLLSKRKHLTLLVTIVCRVLTKLTRLQKSQKCTLLAVFYLMANNRDRLSSTLSVGCNSNVLFLYHLDAILNSILNLKMYSMLKIKV